MVTTADPPMAVSLDGYSPEELLRLHRQMVLIRRFEEKVNEMYTRAKIGGYCHLNIGEEGSVVGSISAIQDRDYIFTSYREHGHALARGIEPRRIMAELFGKETGVVHGRGGSMHLFDPALHFMGGWGIVGSHLPIGAGAAFAINYRGEDGVVVVYLGEGATNIGAFHETLNGAKLWKLPVVFIVVNNLYEMGTPVSKASAIPDQYRKAQAYEIASQQVDGMDILRVRAATEEAIERTRRTKEPSFLELMAYRFRGHSVIDPARYRPDDELKRWLARDPVLLFQERLRQAKLLSDDQLAGVEQEIEAVVEEAVAFADASPNPDLSTLYDFLYEDLPFSASPSGRGQGEG